MRKLLLAAAAGIAATLALAPGPASAALMFTNTTFNGFNAVIEPSGLGWVTPKIAAGDDFTTISALCPGGPCTGALAGLTWATNAQVAAFWSDRRTSEWIWLVHAGLLVRPLYLGPFD